MVIIYLLTFTVLLCVAVKRKRSNIVLKKDASAEPPDGMLGLSYSTFDETDLLSIASQKKLKPFNRLMIRA